MPTMRREGTGKGQIDYHGARELELFIDNDREAYRQKMAYVLNVARKMKAGKFKLSLSGKLWQYFVDGAAKKYAHDYGTGTQIFSKATRQHVARKLASYEAAAIRAGNYGELKNLKHWRL